jgi:pimeloyl-ACP methyl ester carboxylesterase
LSSQPSVTLYLHGTALAASEFLLVGANMAEKLAQLGHASVVIEQLGVSPSTRPDGLNFCSSVSADVAQQIVDQLRSGQYNTGTLPFGISFNQVALAGSSLGGFTAEIAAIAFQSAQHHIDGLVVMNYADEALFGARYRELITGTTFKAYPKNLQPLKQPLVGTSIGQDGSFFICLNGGLPADNKFGGPLHYAPFFGDAAIATESAYDDPDLLSQIVSDAQLFGCGIVFSQLAEESFVTANLSAIKVPVTVIVGDHDMYFPATVANQSAAFTQSLLFTGSSDVSAYSAPNAGHITSAALQPSRDLFINNLSAWLTAHGF